MEIEVADANTEGKLLNSLLIGVKSQPGFEKWSVSLGSFVEMEVGHKSGAKIIFARRPGSKAQPWVAKFADKDKILGEQFCTELTARMKALLDGRAARNATKTSKPPEE